MQKFVVSRSAIELTWKNSTLISGDVVAGLRALKNSYGPELLVFGSSNFVQTLLQYGLVDVLQNWIFPVTLGSGQRLFEDGTQAAQWHLESSAVSTTGVIIASYTPAGPVQTGQMGI